LGVVASAIAQVIAFGCHFDLDRAKAAVPFAVDRGVGEGVVA